MAKHLYCSPASGIPEKTPPVKVQIGIEVRLVGIDVRCFALRNVGLAKELWHHRPVLAFDQGMVIRLPGWCFGAGGPSPSWRNFSPVSGSLHGRNIPSGQSHNHLGGDC